MKEERFPHTRKPLRGRRLRVVGGGALEPRRRAQQEGCGGQSGEIPEQRIGAEQHTPAREACVLTHQGGRGLGAEARASVLAGRESGKSLQLLKRQETFSCLFVSRRTRRGDSERRLNELQRRARAVTIRADPTATGAQREKRRDSRTEEWCRAALTSLRGLSAHPPGRAGAGS